MATPSSILAWRIPWTEEPGRLQSTGSQRVGRDQSDLERTHTHTHTRTCICIADSFCGTAETNNIVKQL